MSDAFFTVAWIGIIVYFLVFETWALLRKKRGDTLSEKTWDWFCLKGGKAGKGRWCMVRRVLFFGFWVWLSIHFLTGGAWM